MSAYTPTISNYKPFYFKKASDGTRRDSREWGLIAKSNPFPALPSPKEPYTNDWKDENGEESYVSTMHYKPIEFEVSFYVKTIKENGSNPVETLNTQVRNFFNYIKDGYFSIYDSYTGIGRQQVRYAGYTEDSFKAKENWARAIFKIKFKVDDPITYISL